VVGRFGVCCLVTVGGSLVVGLLSLCGLTASEGRLGEGAQRVEVGDMVGLVHVSSLQGGNWCAEDGENLGSSGCVGGSAWAVCVVSEHQRAATPWAVLLSS
jgi:hypothetical protein